MTKGFYNSYNRVLVKFELGIRFSRVTANFSDKWVAQINGCFFTTIDAYCKDLLLF